MTTSSHPEPERGGSDAPDGEHHLSEELHELYELAIEAELETDRREETEDEARRHLVWRIIRIVGGTAVCLVGVVALFLPGPGLLLLAIGLGILSRDVPFARRLLEKVRARLPEDEDGNVPLPMIVVSSAVTIVAVAASIWWAFFR